MEKSKTNEEGSEGKKEKLRKDRNVHKIMRSTTKRQLKCGHGMCKKAAFAANNRGRLKRILEYAWMNKVDIVLLSEIIANNNGKFWMGSEEGG